MGPLARALCAAAALQARAAASADCALDPLADSCHGDAPGAGGLHLLQQSSAAQHGKAKGSGGGSPAKASAAAAAGTNPVFGPETFPMAVSEDDLAEWPVRMPDNPGTAKREAICLQAFQSSFDCHFIPADYGGPPCPCLESQVWMDDCNNWYAMQMTGSKYYLPNNTKSAPITGDYSETTEFCNKAFQTAYDCMEIPLVDGGGKGDDCASDCGKWFNQCMGGDADTSAQHKGTVAWPEAP